MLYFQYIQYTGSVTSVDFMSTDGPWLTVLRLWLFRLLRWCKSDTHSVEAIL